MSFLISEAISDLSQELNIVGQKVSETDFILFFNRANEYFNTAYKMPTTQRAMDMLLFDGVFEYGAPSDFSGFMMPERPYLMAQSKFAHSTQSDVVHNLWGNQIAFKFQKETNFFVINYGARQDISGENLTALLIHNLDSITDNGTWSVSGDGASLAVDGQYFTEGTGALRFTVTTSSGYTTLVNSTMSALDLTDYIANGFIFLDFSQPSTTVVVPSIRLRIGTDASNYYEVTSTTRYRGDTIGNGYGQIGWDMSTKTTTGSPTLTNIAYVQLYINNSTISGTFRVDNLFIANPTFFTLPYYSKYNVKSTGGTYQQKVTATSDTMLCPPDLDGCFFYKVLEIAAVLKMGDSIEASYYRGEMDKKEAYLRAKYPSQEQHVTSSYYRSPRKF